jgi:AcrR family transcriptional regulator
VITLADEVRARDAQATRLALLKAAQRRFAVMGYDRTTTRDVAEDAGVNPALINRYFGGKDGLFEAVLAAAPDLLASKYPLSEDLVGDFLASLSPGSWPEFGQHPLLLLLRDSSASEEIQVLRSAGMRAAVDRLVEASGLAAGREAEIRAQLLLALLSGIVVHRFMTPVEPLASASDDELRPALQDAVDALLRQSPPAGRSRRDR